MEQKILNLLGLASKAGVIVSGEDSVVQFMVKKKAKIVFIANDCSPKTLDKFKKKCYFYNIECYDCFSSEKLSQSIGKTRKVIAVCDHNFYEGIKKYLGGENNEG